ncbi:MAG: Rossmann-fold NAD(P)-binding domain-containing protein [Eubacteriales bacterium]
MLDHRAHLQMFCENAGNKQSPVNNINVKKDKKVFWIIGAGRFGQIAAARLSARYPQASFLVVDIRAGALDQLAALPVNTVQEDGVGFLAKQPLDNDFPSYIIPAVPVHLAFEWLKIKLGPALTVSKISLPQELTGAFSNSVMAGTGKLFISYATFLCPDDCPEHPRRCSATGRKRLGRLYRDLEELEIKDFYTLCIRSFQLAPGVGGYKPEALWSTLEKIMAVGPENNYLMSTACLCHGVTDAFRLQS